MRKLQKPRVVPCAIPRPPSPPQSPNSAGRQVRATNRLLLNPKHSRTSPTSSSSTASVLHSPPRPTSDIVACSIPDNVPPPAPNSSIAVAIVEPLHQPPSDMISNALETCEEFPPPPDEFLEDIRAAKKTEEIEGPLDEPRIPSPPSPPAHPLDDDGFDLTSHFARVVNLCNGSESLNSSFAESASEQSASCSSPSTSPHSSPLPSPSITSLDSASTSNCTISDRESGFSCPTRFPFPPPPLQQRLRPATAIATSKGIVIALTGVTQQMNSSRLNHVASAINSLSAIGGGTLPRGAAPAGNGAMPAKRPPPDYLTAMQRLRMMRNLNQMPLNNDNAVVSTVDGASRRGPKSALKVNQSQRPSQVLLKKKVSFSDQVELVAHSADIEEEHLPNPLLERVLGARYLAENGINNGAVSSRGSTPLPQ